MRTLGILLMIIGVVAFFGGFGMAIAGDNHVFSVGGGASYYGLAVTILIPGGFLLIPIGWGILADNGR